MSASCGISGRTTRVLLVEDNELVSSVLSMVLTEFKSTEFVVESVTTLGAALERILDPLRKKPGLIILDLDLPDSRGVASVEELQNRVPDVPMVVFTGHGPVMSADCLRAGAQEYISKGDWTIKDVIDKVQTALVRHEVRGKFAKVERQMVEMDGTVDKIARVEDKINHKQDL